MYLRKIIPTLSLLAISGIAACDENYSNVSLGPTFFSFKDVQETCDTSSEHEGLYCGARAEIDYLIPNDMYMGAVGVYAPGSMSAYHTLATTDASKSTTSGIKSSTYLWQIEGKLGRHFGLGQDSSVVPYVGVGAYHIDSTMTVKSNTKASEVSTQTMMDWRYVAAGFSASHTMNPILDIGIGFKVLRHFHAVQQDIAFCVTTKTDLKAKWGYEVSLPIKIETSENSQWNISVEPFFLKINASSKTNVVGARICVQKGF